MRAHSRKTQPAVSPAAAGQRPASASRPKLKVVVLYAEFESALEARALLDRVALGADWPGEVESQFWRFDVMSQPLVAREALYRAADADMLVLTARQAGYPPDWLLEWLEIWAITRRIQDAVLAAWCRGHDPAVLSQGVECLRELAGRYGLDFLCAEEVSREAA